MPLRKKTFKKKTMKRNLGKKTKKCCKCKSRCYYKKKKTCKKSCKKRCKNKCSRRRMKGGSQIEYYKLNDQTMAPRDFLTSSRIHGCSGGSKKTKKNLKGGYGHGKTVIPTHLLNLGRGLGNELNQVKSGFLGTESNPSPYPTKHHPINNSVKDKFTYTPSNIRGIRQGAELEVGKL